MCRDYSVELFLSFFGPPGPFAGGLVSFTVMRWFEARMPWRSEQGPLLALVATTVAGFVVVILAARLLRIRELDPYLRRLRLA